MAGIVPNVRERRHRHGATGLRNGRMAASRARDNGAVNASTIDEYLAALPGPQRAALELLRSQVHAAAPGLVETIAYAVPGFRLGRHYFLGFGATKTACSFYTGGAPLQELAAELEGYRTSKGTINYPPDRPLPADLVARIVAVRLAEFRAAGK
jgi:uncharacterized protein YdhG (YjbR/CyaY superfamily)